MVVALSLAVASETAVWGWAQTLAVGTAVTQATVLAVKAPVATPVALAAVKALVATPVAMAGNSVRSYRKRKALPSFFYCRLKSR